MKKYLTLALSFLALTGHAINNEELIEIFNKPNASDVAQSLAEHFPRHEEEVKNFLEFNNSGYFKKNTQPNGNTVYTIRFVDPIGKTTSSYLLELDRFNRVVRVSGEKFGPFDTSEKLEEFIKYLKKNRRW